MKTEATKKYNREYMIMVTIQFPLYFSNEEEDNGTEIPDKLIKSELLKMINAKDYEINEQPMD